MRPVVVFPKSGFPEVSSNTQPTAAIAATQETNRKTPLFGVTLSTPKNRSSDLLLLHTFTLF
jgi:hypothetical protein